MKLVKKGYALATVLVLLGVAMFGVGAIVTISTLESKIARSQSEGLTTYYVAEAGIQDAIWRLNNVASYANYLLTLNSTVTYTITNLPNAGQSAVVTITQDGAKGLGYGTVESEGSSDNGIFVAKRVLRAQVFSGPISGPNPTGSNAFMAGGLLSLTNNNQVMRVNGGDVYAIGNIGFNLGATGTVNVGANKIISSGTFSVNRPANVTAGQTVNSSPTQTPPSISFAYYSSNNTASYTAATAVNLKNALIASGGFTGVAYYNGNLTMNNAASYGSKNIVLNGILVVNGSFTFSATGSTFTVTDPGNGKAGIFVNGNCTISNGTWNFNGVLFCAGTVTYSNTSAMTINGGIVSGQAFTFSNGSPFNLTYNAGRITAAFAQGSTYVTKSQHWEEEY